MIAEENPALLKTPVIRVAAPDVPCPHSVYLESNFMIPSEAKIIEAVKKTLA